MHGYREEIRIGSYDEEIDKAQVEELERRCEVGPSKRAFLFTDTMGDPLSRIRNSPMFNMLVAKTHAMEVVGVIQGTIKIATIRKPPKDLAKAGYILGLRVSPLHRRKGIGSSLVHGLEQWFIANKVDYAFMATDENNKPSVDLFINKFGFAKFRTPTILVNPVHKSNHLISKKIEILKLKIEQAEFMYRKFMSSTEFFPQDIDKILRNKLSLGTWVAYQVGEPQVHQFGSEFRVPTSWAMVSVWNSSDVFKLRLAQAPLRCIVYSSSSRLLGKMLPCIKVPSMPTNFENFGFYFMYGLHGEGSLSGKLVRALCKFVNNMARTRSCDCKFIVTEVGGDDAVRRDIPHWKSLSCPEDLWCIKALKNREEDQIDLLDELIKKPPTRALFVDPREV